MKKVILFAVIICGMVKYANVILDVNVTNKNNIS